MRERLEALRSLLFAPIGGRLLIVLSAVPMALAVYGAANPPLVSHTVSPDGHSRDVDLYNRVVNKVASGEGYYAAATETNRAAGYPTRPSLTIRLPVLATALSFLPSNAWRLIVLQGLAMIALLTFFASLRPEDGNGVVLSALVMTGLSVVGDPDAPCFHEPWAAVFIVLSLAARRHTALSVALALVGVLIREVALPFLVAMLIVRLLQREYRATIAWAVALAVFAIALFVHLEIVGHYVLPSDHRSAGWVGMQGWPFVLKAAGFNNVLIKAGFIATAIVVPFALLGLMLWKTELGVICCLTAFMYVLAFLLIGRADTSYWGVLLAPFLLTGLPALARAWTASLGRLRARYALRGKQSLPG